MISQENDITIFGAGLVGSVLAALLRKKNINVTIYEKRQDPRIFSRDSGRSINLALSHRGLKAIKELGIGEAVFKEAIPMFGRMIHELDGQTNFQPYSLDGDEAIYSISRGKLNEILINEAERRGAVFLFDSPLKNELSSSDVHIGADGINSKFRDFISNCHAKYEPLSHQYIEVYIPPLNGDFAFKNYEALHIWPRKSFMFIALPNPDKSFTGTLFLAKEGEHSFESYQNKLNVLFEEYFKDVMDCVPNLTHELENNPISNLGTLYCDNWIDDRKFLIGDAAHAIVPFYGQGMNAGFEDAIELYHLIEPKKDWNNVIQHYFEKRKPNADAIASLALYNFIEMRDKVSDPEFLKLKKINHYLHEKLGKDWIDLYGMVTFSDLSYKEALDRGFEQKKMIEKAINSYGLEKLLSLDVFQLKKLFLIDKSSN